MTEVCDLRALEALRDEHGRRPPLPSPPVDIVSEAHRTRMPIVFDDWTGQTHTIPTGFPTDLASLPWWLGWLFPKTDQTRAWAAVLHDYLFRVQPIDQNGADRTFERFLAVWNYHVARRTLMYLGLRLFGWRAWNQNKRDAPAMREEWTNAQPDQAE